MKALTILKRATLVTAAVALISVYALSARAAAIPYTPDSTGTTSPAFNVFTGVPQEGDESDFVRGKEETDGGASVNNVQSACKNGTRYTIRVYVHNAANQTLNNGGNGSGVARGTKVRVALPQTTNNSISGVISANNATTVSDNMRITCANGKTVNLSYVNGSAKQFTGFTGTKALSDTIVTTGAPVGTMEPNGDVWGCFAQRVWVTLTVKVEEVPKEQPPKPEQPKPEQPKPEQPKKPEQPRVVPQQPAVLPVTGPAGVGAMAGLVGGLSSLGYYLVNRRRG